MWNPFRRKSEAGSFPKPRWPPIQNLDQIDLAAERPDGGVDLGIVASQPIDNSAQTLESIRRKIEAYLRIVDEYETEMGQPRPDKVAIVLLCKHPIHTDAALVIQECRAMAAAKGVELQLRTAVA
jgi:hypothetical protein